MALPSRPNARVGLPSNPAPRSRSLSRRPTRDDLPRPASSATEFIPFRPAPTPPPTSIRPQRSMTDLRSSPARSRSVDSRRQVRPSSPPPPLPLAPIPMRPGVGWTPMSRSPDDSAQSYVAPRKRSDGSVSSWSSASSGSSESQNSLRSFRSYASSRTSVAEDDAVNEVKAGGGEQESGRPDAETSPTSAGGSPDGLRSALWNRVAAAAGNLKVNVSKALGASLTHDAGEETPAGQESRLTRAMKAYHVEKARDAKDLPDWLFEGRDREVIARLRGNSTSMPEQKSEVAIERPATASPAPALQRDAPLVRDSSRPPSAWSPAHSRASSASSVQSVHATVPSRDAMHRLKELRVAKRNARVRFADDEEVSDKIEHTIRRPPTPSAADSSRNSSSDMSRTETTPNTPHRRPTVHRTADLERGGSARPRVGLPTNVRPRRDRGDLF